jgi:hypothetical protein
MGHTWHSWYALCLFGQPGYPWNCGVDVMITIFGDFSQFSAKKLVFFLNTNVMINFFQNLALFWVKNANFFAKIFGENISKIITSVPGYPWNCASMQNNLIHWQRLTQPSTSLIALRKVSFFHTAETADFLGSRDCTWIRNVSMFCREARSNTQ